MTDREKIILAIGLYHADIDSFWECLEKLDISDLALVSKITAEANQLVKELTKGISSGT